MDVIKIVANNLDGFVYKLVKFLDVSINLKKVVGMESFKNLRENNAMMGITCPMMVVLQIARLKMDGNAPVLEFSPFLIVFANVVIEFLRHNSDRNAMMGT